MERIRLFNSIVSAYAGTHTVAWMKQLERVTLTSSGLEIIFLDAIRG